MLYLMALTHKEILALKALQSNPSMSLRDLANYVELAGLSSATYVVNSLVKKGMLRKVGKATRKKYEVTEQALNEITQIDLSAYKSISDLTEHIFNQDYGGTVSMTESAPKYWQQSQTSGTHSQGTGAEPKNFTELLLRVATQSTQGDWFNKNFKSIFVWCLIVIFLVFPASLLAPGEKWFEYFLTLIITLLVIRIIEI